MNKKILTILGIILPVGAFLLTSCGPENQDLSVDQASDNWVAYNGIPSEWGRCNDGWDNNGNGRTDYADWDCLNNPGPVRDLSMVGFPIGHNFFPDPARIFPGGPGVPGGFRDRDQITRWFRFLTEPDGNVAGIDLMSPGVNPAVVPIPALLPKRIPQGTFAQGNNNNVSLRGLHTMFLEHGFLGPQATAALSPAPLSGNPYQSTAAQFAPSFMKQTRGFPGWPGVFYRGGSQGALRPARTGNPDGGNAENAPVDPEPGL